MILGTKAQARVLIDGERRPGAQALQVFAELERSGLSAHLPPHPGLHLGRNEGRATQGVRPSSGIPKGFIPRGRFQRRTGRPARQCLSEVDWRRRKPEPPSRKGYPAASHAAGMGSESAKAMRFSHAAPLEAAPKGEVAMAGREVEGVARSSGVPVDVVECKKHRESSKGVQALGSSCSPAYRCAHLREGVAVGSGSRQRKARRRGDPRLETRVIRLSKA